MEGMPLGLELAAAWTRSMSCEAIAQQIEQDVAALAARSRNRPHRHRTIHAVFDYSWQLLTDEERRSMAAVSIFRGGFTADAARCRRRRAVADAGRAGR